MTVIMSFSIYTGFIIITSMQNGMDSLSERMGADLVVVPKGCGSAEKEVLLSGSRNYFYMDGRIKDTISDIKGVSSVAGQFYLTNLSSGCCSGKMQIIGYDPKNDFILKPWISSGVSGTVGRNELIAGNNVIISNDGTVRVFGRKYHVAGQLEKTSTGLDDSVYAGMDMIPQMLSDAENKGFQFIEQQKEKKAVSTIFVRLSNSADRSQVEKAIDAAEGAYVDIIEKSELTGQTETNLHVMAGCLSLLMSVLCLCGISVIVIMLILSMNSRRKEFSSLRMMGMTDCMLIKMTVFETFMLCGIGSVAGTVLSAVLILPFGTYIGQRLNMPYIQPDAAELITVAALNIAAGVIAASAAALAVILKIRRSEIYTVLKAGEC